ncbi:hypothetical protein C7U92_28040 [Bradyrhizobium sp. WBOS7]|uniref:Uncharacterized protein n=1 Tax=Bradyrhizobium betae TaxID=244734 RepID=A0AAE9NAU1_9BRAD|nr:hypothetical protein [Bradyrhizobium sp. WBOS2]MDD1574508.1 hypothetical protein [Bradyrhizobium sp. WBOS1]MDD1580544.1 hypothetical protein [Bradyrhizobium sp. WBOS7]MDD1605043.1 hypothetical protein [Bradyrhizobium sp. WBOS16]UUO35529.1 hypothetical protein DCK84_13795 [Bradyrhizobium sp. WBOS01]UUO41838.1 hypothetical protein DCM75_14550 [Bradyrhizobium sp. WBOS02]UUO56175.1 hypothetical protein DCM79_26340 [Bradyrhizobium sp. WBOS07]UUO66168.1 hypothetical protein DCM83_13805 [Bradyrh
MAGLDPAIHVLPRDADVDARDKPGHDGSFVEPRPTTTASCRALPRSPGWPVRRGRSGRE